jgi:hypothetical protein
MIIFPFQFFRRSIAISAIIAAGRERLNLTCQRWKLLSVIHWLPAGAATLTKHDCAIAAELFYIIWRLCFASHYAASLISAEHNASLSSTGTALPICFVTSSPLPVKITGLFEHLVFEVNFM